MRLKYDGIIGVSQDDFLVAKQAGKKISDHCEKDAETLLEFIENPQDTVIRKLRTQYKENNVS